MENLGDIFGYPLKVGDKVIMASGGKQDDRLYTGIIVGFIAGKGSKTVRVKKDGGSINRRSPEDLMSLVHVEENMPELFL